MARCKYCLSDLHQTDDCCYAPIDEGKVKGRHSQQRLTSESNNNRPSIQFACCLMRKEAANVDTKAASLLTCALNAMEVIPLLSVGKGSHNLVQGSRVMLLLTAMLNWFYDLL